MAWSLGSLSSLVFIARCQGATVLVVQPDSLDFLLLVQKHLAVVQVQDSTGNTCFKLLD